MTVLSTYLMQSVCQLLSGPSLEHVLARSWMPWVSLSLRLSEYPGGPVWHVARDGFEPLYAMQCAFAFMPSAALLAVPHGEVVVVCEVFVHAEMLQLRSNLPTTGQV